MRDRRHRAVALLAGASAVAACGDPSPEEVVCPVRGHHGAGGFRGVDCALDDDACLETTAIAAGAATRVLFCPYGDGEVTEVTSSDPAVLRVEGWSPQALARQNIDLAAGVPGTASLEVRGPGLDERVELTVEAVAAVTLVQPRAVAAGGTSGLYGEKTGTSGRRLIGRGGYDVAIGSPFITVSRPDPEDWCRHRADHYLGSDVVGMTRVAPEPASLGGSVPVSVISPGAITSLRLISEGGIRPLADRFTASIWVWTGGIEGVQCEWRTTRPAEVRPVACGVTLVMDTDEPFEAICSLRGFEWARIDVYVEEQSR